MQPEKVVTVLSVSADENHHADLRVLFRHSNWVLLEARTCTEGLAMLRRNPIPVVLCDDCLPDGTWKDLACRSAAAPPAVIVAAHGADDQLWMDVLNSGAYNVIDKPFNRAELFRLISAAWTQWRDQRAGALDLQRARAAG